MRRPLQTLVVGIVLLLLFGAVFQYAWRIKMPKRVQIGVIQEPEHEFDFVPPKGDHFNFVIGIAGSDSNLSTRIVGTIVLSNATTTVRIPFDTDKAVRGNWLQAEGLDAYIITLASKRIQNFDKVVSGDGGVHVRVEAQRFGDGQASLWLCYLERWIHRRLTQIGSPLN